MANELQTKLDAIKLDKDTNLLPENLKAGITCLGVNGTLESGGSSTKLNIFMQQEEPIKKDGIWFKGDYEIKNIIACDEIHVEDKWDTAKMNSMKSIPYDFYTGSAVAIGTNVYLFGGSGGFMKAYKYDTLTDTYTSVTDIPYSYTFGAAVSVNTDIYLFGGSNGTTTAYKYNTLTDTYTQLSDIPYTFRGGSGVSVNTDIYLFGGINVVNNAYKYDTLTGTYTKLADIPYEFQYGSAVAINNFIYLFGSSKSGNYTTAYKYDISTNTYLQLTNIPYEFNRSSVVSSGNYIYLLGSSVSSYKQTVYRYNTLTDVYAQLTNMYYQFTNGAAVLVGNYIYAFGGANNKNSVQTRLIPTDYGDNSIVITQNDTNNNETNIADIGISGLKTYYNKAYYVETLGSVVTDIEVYNGDSTNWNKIS